MRTLAMSISLTTTKIYSKQILGFSSVSFRIFASKSYADLLMDAQLEQFSPNSIRPFDFQKATLCPAIG